MIDIVGNVLVFLNMIEDNHKTTALSSGGFVISGPEKFL